MKTCYKVLVRLTSKESKTPEAKAYEVLAEHPTEAEDAVIADHAKDWERDYLFDGVQAVFPCDESLA